MQFWYEAFSKGAIAWKDEWHFREHIVLRDISALKKLLDLVHIRYGLIKPYFENKNYPVVESRELLPSFEPDLLEYAGLPSFSMAAFARAINYFQEVFQFDLIAPLYSETTETEAKEIITRNTQTICTRIYKGLREEFQNLFQNTDISNLDHYPALQPFLFQMDRAQVIAMNGDMSGKNNFCLNGVYASFPSDLDTEIKRFGLRIGKFKVGDNEMYDANRLFVYQYLMELYGFPISSERRTSAALFARRLHKMGEKFIVRTLGQSDRTITSVWNDSAGRAYPKVEKIALINLDQDQTDLLPTLKEGGFFVDQKKRVLILRVKYAQHKFNEHNVRQDRALSVDAQEVIHPVTGEVLAGINIIKDATNMFLRLNDIVRGEYTGYIVYKRNELIENTNTDEKKLKFLYAWLSKHQYRIIGYSDEFFANVAKVLEDYLHMPENYMIFASMNDLYQELIYKYSYIRQARKIRILEELKNRKPKGQRISYAVMLEETAALLHQLKFEIVSYFDPLVADVINIGESILHDRYLVRTYIERKETDLTPVQSEIKKNYGKLVSLVDEFKAIRKARLETQKQNRSLLLQAS